MDKPHALLLLRKKGFTLVEIMIVIMIIGLLAAISMPSYKKAREDARKALCQQSQRVVREATEMYLFENAGAEDTLIKRSLRDYFQDNEIPTCPSGGKLQITRPRIDDIRVRCTYDNGVHTLDSYE